MDQSISFKESLANLHLLLVGPIVSFLRLCHLFVCLYIQCFLFLGSLLLFILCFFIVPACTWLAITSPAPVLPQTSWRCIFFFFNISDSSYLPRNFSFTITNRQNLNIYKNKRTIFHSHCIL